ncbi:protein SPIRAL1-like 1 [Impatiens glandulifera]|uniref:protein SPIRAL1-like 1 n=1 Tax=Impatiens glandulifera TaxID=253017 RepID=UPI001FB1241A|nr:protein SPIRAL1-like 1 [Impatiens glandulifera]XP_047322135.1 protein SPIRAL1-like 1 [Impatiens glandulifera]
MNRGVSAGGGQSSLGYLFGGGGDSPKPAVANERKPTSSAEIEAAGRPSSNRVVTAAPAVAAASSQPAPVIDASKQIPAGIHSSTTNNYTRADGQNTGNFLTDRPSTKVHAAPGGGSSLDYLFGGGK